LDDLLGFLRRRATKEDELVQSWQFLAVYDLVLAVCLWFNERSSSLAGAAGQGKRTTTMRRNT
jgi:hypothetical protein